MGQPGKVPDDALSPPFHVHNKPMSTFIDIPIDPGFMQRVKNLCILHCVMDRGLLRFMPTGIFPEVRHLGTGSEGRQRKKKEGRGTFQRSGLSSKLWTSSPSNRL